MSFRVKTSLGIAVLQAVMFLGLIWSGLYVMHASNEKQVVTRASTTATLFASLVKDAVLATDLASLDSFVAEVLTSPDVLYARVFDQERVLAEGGDDGALAHPFVADQRLADVQDGVFDTTAEIREAGVTFGRIELGLSTASMQATFDRALRLIIILATAGIVVMVCCTFILVVYLTRQLMMLKDAAQQIAVGALEHQIPVRGRDEIAQTAIAFNQMALQPPNALWELALSATSS